ncbi:hypothetical protein K435DRAFT_89259 [Dendrothele bispora CBS 962.96]|uniref:Uncharacterized protein n=1 Tax=Dendrothele bispora (strain CBS 962.96) TaxID=1314807 RepID=A0A4S8KQC3_DENBC|nr:hypothetical protein K435DRAFT_89259 [Dendrothele bispora CBS 962.96]
MGNLMLVGCRFGSTTVTCLFRSSLSFSPMFFARFWSVYSVPETANVSLEEVDKMFGSSMGSEERALKKHRIEEDIVLSDLAGGGRVKGTHTCVNV